MDKNEVIILSSDDESEFRQFEKYKPSVTIKLAQKSINNIKTRAVTPKTSPQNTVKRKLVMEVNNETSVIANNKVPRLSLENASKKCPEVVDLVHCSDKSPKEINTGQKDCEELKERKNGEIGNLQNHSKLQVIDIDTGEDDLQKHTIIKTEKKPDTPKVEKSIELKTTPKQENVTNETIKSICKEGKTSDEVVSDLQHNSTGDDKANEGSNQNLKLFTEFVEFCGSLETIPSDRVRLTKKLMKRYGEADLSYIKSQEFGALIKKCKEKVNKQNLYLIAKDITAELSFKKKNIIIAESSNVAKENNQSLCESANKDELTDEKINKQKKRNKTINKILKKLDKLGNKIRELENEEVDLSDEETSSYVRLQRYRERFCQIYKKLCQYTNEIPDAERVFRQKICFTESKYPAINKCIEVWLNKTKRFPDFTDVLKLLESQSSSLGLPSNRDSLRPIAIEIFQQVGIMLQRRRKYDLWDSFCGFLDDQIDPAESDPVLDKILKENFDTRTKKEQEIFRYYSELQEKERLEPEEVPEEEANRSPIESGNEDDKEIEEIENDINKRLEVASEEDTKDESNSAKFNDDEESNSSKEEPNRTSIDQKESKNNYKNCKSLKYRSECLMKSKSESDESSAGVENNEKDTNKLTDVDETVPEKSPKPTESLKNENKNDSDLELLPLEAEPKVNPKSTPVKSSKTPDKQNTGENSSTRKKINMSCYQKKTNNVEHENSLDKSGETFDIHYCHFISDNVFENLNSKSKDLERRKVFRDLTNVTRLMELHGKNRNIRSVSGLFAPSFFYRGFEKPSWKGRFKVSYRLVGSKDQKCALTEEKTGKNVSSDTGGESDEKDDRNNSEGGGDERDGFFSGHGGESHEDGDEDKNRKNGKTDNDVGDSKPEEEEEDDEEKDDNETRTESTEHSEETEDSKKVEWPSEIPNKTGNESDTQVPNSSQEAQKSPEADQQEEPNTADQETDEDTEEDTTDDRTDEQVTEEQTEITEQRVEEPVVNIIEDHEESEISGIDVEKTEEPEDTKSPPIKEESNLVAEEIKAEMPEDEKPNLTNTVVTKPKRLSLEKMNYEIPKSITIGGSVMFTPPEHYKSIKKENGNVRTTPVKESPRTTSWNSCRKPSRKTSTSDEEIVKRFLLHSPASISITPPKTLSLTKPPSQAALQALATLRSLKGISTTIVKGKPKREDDAQRNSSPAKRRRVDPPLISNVPSTYPKIVTVQGNVSGFDNTEAGNSEGSSSIRISNVWGNLPNNFMQAMDNSEPGVAGCSTYDYQPSNYQPQNVVRKRNTKKKVQYVVLD